jgi:hypothetical protein
MLVLLFVLGTDLPDSLKENPGVESVQVRAGTAMPRKGRIAADTAALEMRTK